MAESNINTEESPTPIKRFKSGKKRRYKRTYDSPFSSFGFLFLMTIIALGIASGMWRITKEQTNQEIQSISESTIIDSIPTKVQDDLLIEFSDQEIPFDCKAYDYRDYNLVEWNGTIKVVVPVSELNYISRSEGGLLALPEFYIFLNDNYDMASAFRDDKRCFSKNDFVYNITIAGKTVSNSYYIRFEDCQEDRYCKLREYFNNIVS